MDAKQTGKKTGKKKKTLRVHKLLRAKVAGSGALLLIAAAVHGADVQRVTEAVESLPVDLAAMTRGLWLFFSWHMAVLGLAALLGAASGWSAMRPVLFFCGLVAAGDFLWVFALTGWGVDTVLMLLASLGLLIGSALWRPRRETGSVDPENESVSPGER